MTVLAAFAVLLSRYSDQDDLLIGTPIANRRHRWLEGPRRQLRQHPGAARRPLGVTSCLRAARAGTRTCLEAYAHQDLPFERWSRCSLLSAV